MSKIATLPHGILALIFTFLCQYLQDKNYYSILDPDMAIENIGLYNITLIKIVKNVQGV